MEITAKFFEKCVGRPPSGYELELCNCPYPDKIGHWTCGWSSEENLPQFMTNKMIKVEDCKNELDRL